VIGAFNIWVRDSEQDREIERDFWRRFIGHSRKRLAQAINFIYQQMAYSSDPTPTIDALFPMKEFEKLLNSLSQDEALDDVELRAIARMQDLFQGKYWSPLSA
jgi:hypothetical protein